MAPQLDRITAERVQTELDKLLLGDAPGGAASSCMVDTGLADAVLPEVPAMRLAIDEHHQHKDVYEHSLTVLEQAIDLRDGGPDLVLRLGGAAARHRQARHPQARAGRRRELPPPRGGRREDGPQAAAGAEVLRSRSSTTSSQLVFLHLRFHGYGDGEWTDSAVRRYVTDAGPLLAAAAQAGARGLHDPQQARGPRAAGAPTTTSRSASRELAAEEDLARVRPGPRRQRDHGAARRPAGPRGRRGVAAPQGAPARPRPVDRDEAEAELLAWWNPGC